MDTLDHETISSFGGLLPPLKQQWHYLQHTKKSTSQDDMHFVPDHDILDPSSWADLQPPSGLNMEGKFMMDGKFSMDSKFSKQMWQQPDITCWMPSQPADGVTPSIPEGRENDPTNLDSLVGGVLDQHQSQQQNLSTSFHDEDIQAWLQYPLDDAAPESNYCLESWGELPPSSPVNREPLGNGNGTVSRQGFSGKPNGGNNSGSVMGINPLQNGLRGSNAEEAMDLAAKRASGMIPVSGVETFNKVRSTSMPTITTSNVKWIPSVNGKVSAPSSCPLNGLESSYRGKVSHTGIADLPKENVSVQPSGLASQVTMAPPPTLSNRAAPINFAHFSRPAAIYRNLQSMEAGVCGGMNSSLKAGGKKTRSLSTTSSSVAESTIMTASAVPGVKLVDSPTSVTYFPGSGRIQDQEMGRGRGGDTGNQIVSMAETNSPGIRRMMKSASAGVPARKNSLQKNASLPVKLGEDQNDMGNASTVSRVLGNGNGNGDQVMILHSKQSLEATSCYDGESYDMDDKNGIAAWTKRKRSQEEDTEYGTSDDAVEESVDTKKQGRGGTATATTSSAKRTRAAEVHNLSERKRRDRINERMKALQDLIPNSNKTDKASMLDEAIEYLKMLQVQLQMMAMRAGMPQMAPGQQFGQMPMGGLNGMAMPQMPQMSQMGMGGVGTMQMGMGMGMTAGMASMGNFGMGMGTGAVGGSIGGPAMGGVGMGVSDLPNMPHSLQNAMGQGMSKCLPQGLPFPTSQRQRQETSCVQSSSSSGQMPSQSGGMSEGGLPRQLAPSTVDPLGAYLSRQQQRQSHQPVNLELYQTFMLQQHQQH